MNEGAMGAAAPQLRFPGFSGPWQHKRLGDFLTFKNGVNADKSMYGRGRKFINVMDVLSGAPIRYETIIGSVSISDAEFAKNEVLTGDLLFQRSSETREDVGQSNIYIGDTPVTFGGFVIRGRQKVDVNTRYLDALLKTQRVRKDMTSRSGGSTRYNIGQDALELVNVCVAPTVTEQTKIADFLNAVEARIGSLIRREQALREYKKGMMQKLFAQTFRFVRPDKSPFPEWEERRLGEVFNERTERGDTTAELLSVTQKDGVRRLADLDRDDNSSADKSNYKKVRKGDIAYNSMRMWQGASGLSDYNGIVSPAYTVISCRRGHVPLFWAYYFKFPRLVHLFQRYSQGLTSDTWNLKFPALAAIKTVVPIEAEQQLIADFLSAIDAKISAAAKQVAAMQAFKRGLLQRMFL